MDFITLRKNLDYTIIEMGISDLQKTYSFLKPNIFSYGEIKNTFNNYGFIIPLGQFDVSYAFLPADILEPLLWDVQALVHKSKYVSDFRDCDNFAAMVQVLMSFFFGINTVGKVLGNIYNNQTSKFIAGHWFNFAITYDPIYKKFELYLSDAMNLGFQKIEKGKPLILNSWLYKDFKTGDFF